MKAGLLFLCCGMAAAPIAAEEAVPSFESLLAHPVRLRPGLEGVHPRVFVTAGGVDELRRRARTTHRAEWEEVLGRLAALEGDPPPSPGPQARRSQNNVAFAIAEASLAYKVEGRPEYLAAARKWLLAAIEYEPWGYTYNKPNVDLAAGHLLYAVGWSYDLLHDVLTPDERGRIRASLERHARLVYEHFAPRPGRRFNFTQNHDFIPTAGLAVAALALMGESAEAPRWAALARAHHHRTATLLSPDGYYYESFEYWIFSAPWLVHFLDAWEHATGESLWEQGPFRNWKLYLAHSLLPDGQNVFDFGDIWEGALTRRKAGAEYARVYPGEKLQSNFNVMYRVAARLRDPEAQAVAQRFAAYGHGNLEEFWTLLWRDPGLTAAPLDRIPLRHHFRDSGVVFFRTSWGPEATAFAFKAGPPEGHRVASLLPMVPEWKLDSGHAHPDANSFIIYAGGRYLTGDTGYAGLPSARNHNTITVGGIGQGVEGAHDVWRPMPYGRLDAVRIVEASFEGRGARIVGEAAAAYPASAGLRRFARTLTFDGVATFTVRDRIQTAEPRTVEWRLQADHPFEGRGRGFVVRAADAELEVGVASPPGARIIAGPAFVLAPGPPGSIEKGRREERGYELVVTPPEPGTVIEFAVKLSVRAAPALTAK